MSGPLRLPPLGAVLLQTRRDALDAFRAAGWGPWATPFDLDAERRRALNLDLAEPEVALAGAGGPSAVAHLETDRDGRVVLAEITTAQPADPGAAARALLGSPGEPRVAGDATAREWVWGPESGSGARVDGEPVRLWIAAEQAYGDRLWIVASVVRRPSDDDGD